MCKVCVGIIIVIRIPILLLPLFWTILCLVRPAIAASLYKRVFHDSNLPLTEVVSNSPYSFWWYLGGLIILSIRVGVIVYYIPSLISSFNSWLSPEASPVTPHSTSVPRVEEAIRAARQLIDLHRPIPSYEAPIADLVPPVANINLVPPVGDFRFLEAFSEGLELFSIFWQ